MVKGSPSVSDMLQQQREAQDEQASSMYGHKKREPVNQPHRPTHLNAEQRQEYAEEQEYNYETTDPHGGVAIQRERAERHRREHPNEYGSDGNYRGPQPTTYERIKASARSAAGSVRRAGGVAYDAGSQARQTGQDIGDTPAVRSMLGQFGFTTPVQAQPRSPQSRQQYPGAPVNEGSVMHPGNTTFIIKCTDGQCEMSQRKQRPPRPPRQQRSYRTGLLGGNDPGL